MQKSLLVLTTVFGLMLSACTTCPSKSPDRPERAWLHERMSSIRN